jgi:Radical SAM superfamily/4Fe-4S single cluster domain
MSKVRCVQVEYHISSVCNFTCVGCSHFSEEGHAGRATVQSFKDEVGPWSKRLAPQYLLLLGGEPTLNPDLVEIVEECGRTWDKEVKKILVSNGWFLHKFPNLPKMLKSTNTRLDLSIHHDSPEYLAKLAEIRDLVKSWGIVPRMRESFRDWSLYRVGHGKDTRPFHDEDPQRSWDVCASRHCLQIHEGMLWKCPPISYLGMHLNKYINDMTDEVAREWEPYSSYRPLDVSCTDVELMEFVNRRSEGCCSMCPASPTPFRKPDPVRRRSLKMISLKGDDGGVVH